MTAAYEPFPGPADPEFQPGTGELDLEDRHALRRVAGLSTELQDVSEVEYRALRLERVVLMGVWTEGTLTSAENSLRELSLLAETAGSEVLDGLIQRRSRPDAATYVGSGKARELAGVVADYRRGHRHLRRRADPRPAAQAGGRGGGQGDRQDRADPGHLRPARPQQGGQGPGRAGPAAVPAAAAARLGRVAVPAGRRPGGRRRRDRHPRPRRDQDRDRPAPDPDQDRQAAPRARRDVATDREVQRGQRRRAQVPSVAIAGLHQRGQVQPAEPADRRRRAGRQLAVRHAGPGGPPGPHPVGPCRSR